MTKLDWEVSKRRGRLRGSDREGLRGVQKQQ